MSSAAVEDLWELEHMKVPIIGTNTKAISLTSLEEKKRGYTEGRLAVHMTSWGIQIIRAVSSSVSTNRKHYTYHQDTLGGLFFLTAGEGKEKEVGGVFFL